MRKVLLLLLFACICFLGKAQDQDMMIDDPGDIIFLGVASAPSSFFFFSLDEIPDGTFIYFTDAPWNGTDAFISSGGGNPGIISWENNTGNPISSGTVIEITLSTNSTNIGALGEVDASFDIPNNNFSIFAMTSGSYTSPGTLLAAIGDVGELNLNNTGLTLGLTAIEVSLDAAGNPKTVVYTGPTSCTGSLLDCLAQFNNPDNWTDGSQPGGTFPPTIPPGGIALPVELIQFTGQAQNDMIKIEWATATEINNDYFQLERSKDGFDFSVIGRVNGKGTTTELTRYSYQDEAPLNGLNYYRLAQYDIDGSMEYSDIIVISMGQVSSGLSDFYPNPTTEGLTQVNYYSDKDTRLVIRLQDMSGRVIQTYRRDLIQGNNTLSFNLKEQNSGVYVVSFEDGNGIKKTKRLVIK